MGEVVFFIEKDGKKIGDAVFLLWPRHREHDNAPVLKLQAILLGESHRFPSPQDLEKRRKGYGTEALETIWTVLRKKDTGVHLPANTLVTLEIEKVNEAWLSKWYEGFGFTLQPEKGFSEFRQMQAPLNKIKFPLYQKHKKAQENATKAAAALE